MTRHRQVEAHGQLAGDGVHRREGIGGFAPDQVRHGGGHAERRPVGIHMHAGADAQPVAGAGAGFIAGHQRLQEGFQARVARQRQRQEGPRSPARRGGRGLSAMALAGFVPGGGGGCRWPVAPEEVERRRPPGKRAGPGFKRRVFLFESAHFRRGASGQHAADGVELASAARRWPRPWAQAAWFRERPQPSMVSRGAGRGRSSAAQGPRRRGVQSIFTLAAAITWAVARVLGGDVGLHRRAGRLPARSCRCRPGGSCTSGHRQLP